MEAIKKSKDNESTAFIDLKECVECGACLQSNVCQSNAILHSESSWLRDIKRSAVTGGRGTGDVKRNDIQGLYKEGEVAVGAEIGRPDVGFYFRDLEKITRELSKLDFDYQIGRSVRDLFEHKTGELIKKELLDEKAMSARIEIRVKTEDVLKVVTALNNISRRIDTVLSIDIIGRCRNGEIPVLHILCEAGIKVRPNGKVNIGLGRPLQK
jgi:hypothetical protein